MYNSGSDIVTHPKSTKDKRHYGGFKTPYQQCPLDSTASESKQQMTNGRGNERQSCHTDKTSRDIRQWLYFSLLEVSPPRREFRQRETF